ncbi:MAG: HutD family protein [Rubrivivax sp.]
MQRVELVACAPQPWRNGGGLTRELLAWPGTADWRLRVSVARIERSGPFSAFPGVRRCFAVLQGAGVRLLLPAGPCTLTPADGAVEFDGAAAPGCELIAGPTEDLNLMATQAAGRPRLQRAAAGSSIAGPARWRGLFATADAQLEWAAGGRTEAVAAGTLAWSTDASGPWQLTAGAGWWLSLET